MKGKSLGAGATKKSKPMKFQKIGDSGKLGPENRRDYSKRGRGRYDGDADDNGAYGKRDGDRDDRRRRR